MEKFSEEINGALGYYVYALSDPATSKVFYIGRGQNNRCFDHLGDESETEKVRKIKEIRKDKMEPQIDLLRYGLSDEEAKLLEATLIDYVGLGSLTNRMRGNHDGSQPRASVEDVIRRYKAEDVEIDDDDMVVLISVGRSFVEGMSEPEIYDYSRGVWKANWKKHRPRFALIVFQRLIREVYEIQGDWLPAGTTEYKHRKRSEVEIPGRWEFTGELAAENIRRKYIDKSVRKYFPKGSRFPLKYEHC